MQTTHTLIVKLKKALRQLGSLAGSIVQRHPQEKKGSLRRMAVVAVLAFIFLLGLGIRFDIGGIAAGNMRPASEPSGLVAGARAAFSRGVGVVRGLLGGKAAPAPPAAALMLTPGFSNPIPLVPPVYTSSIVAGRTGIGGACTGLTCSVTNTARVVDSNIGNSGNMTILLAIAGTTRISVNAGATIPAGQRAGFLVNAGGGLIDLNLLGALRLRTYLGGTLREDVSGAALLDLSLLGGSGNNAISFLATQSFDEIQIEVTTLVGLGINWDVFYAFTQVPIATSPGGVADNILLWYKADAGVTGTTQVTNWADQTGQGHHVSQATPAQAPSLLAASPALNFNPALLFDGANSHLEYLSTRFIATNDPGSVYVVAANNNPSGVWRNAADFGIDNPHMGSNGSEMRMYMNGSSPIFTTHTRPLKNNIAQVLGYHWNGGTNTGAELRLDAFSLLAPTMDFTLVGNSGTTDGMFTVGGYQAVEVWPGPIAEVVAYNRNLTAAEKNRVESYLAIKYGITLGDNTTPVNYADSDGTVIWTGGSPYQNDIAGIGRDDEQVLNQKQSNSVNAGNILTIGNGAIAADNASNGNNFSADKTFMVWGHDGASLAPSVAVAGTSPLLTRMSRIWKTQETGTVGNVLIRVPSASLVGVTPTLIRSTDTTFNSSDTLVPMTLVGSNYEATINFANGDFFTFASFYVTPGGVTAGLAHWVRADQNVFTDTGITPATAGQQVQQWNDQSGHGLHVTANTAGQKPVFQTSSAATNFNPYLDFTSDYLINTNQIVQTTDSLTMISVGTTRVLSGVRTMYSLGNNGNEPTVDLESNFISPFYTFSSPSNVDIFTGGQVPTNLPLLWALRATNNVANDLRFGFQGQEVATTMEIIPNAAYGIKVHVGTGVDTVWDGLIMEGLAYNRRLSDAELAQVNTYLAIKYGITLDADPVSAAINADYVNSAGTVIWSGNNVANQPYHRDVAGIGRDDAAALNQKQSASVNTGNVLTIGNGAIAADNASNANNFSADQSFLVWGHDGASIGAAIPVTGTSPLLTRKARVWKVQETGTVGNVVVRIPVASLGGGTPKLIRSTDATFDSTDTILAMTQVGSNYEAIINFASGDFFTFASLVFAPGGVTG
ncbi:MAG TPA: hypothetical protein VGB07_00385, partial [Blastocatellia bacterium]